jgi:hypothetical protein
MRIRIAIWMGEGIIGALAIILALNGHIEGAIGCAGLIAATMDKVVKTENQQ